MLLYEIQDTYPKTNEEWMYNSKHLVLNFSVDNFGILAWYLNIAQYGAVEKQHKVRYKKHW